LTLPITRFFQHHLVVGRIGDRAPEVSAEERASRRFRTIERVFAWEDKFRRLLLRFERISGVHYAFKTLAYTMINLRHYCQI
jgi:hypothetical protein